MTHQIHGWQWKFNQLNAFVKRVWRNTRSCLDGSRYRKQANLCNKMIHGVDIIVDLAVKKLIYGKSPEKYTLGKKITALLKFDQFTQIMLISCPSITFRDHFLHPQKMRIICKLKKFSDQVRLDYPPKKRSGRSHYRTKNSLWPPFPLTW